MINAIVQFFGISSIDIIFLLVIIIAAFSISFISLRFALSKKELETELMDVKMKYYSEADWEKERLRSLPSPSLSVMQQCNKDMTPHLVRNNTLAKKTIS